jgi:hypothetical protein
VKIVNVLSQAAKFADLSQKAESDSCQKVTVGGGRLGGNGKSVHFFQDSVGFLARRLSRDGY